MAAPTILRTQHKLGDYLFEPDLAKFNLPKKISRPWIINTSEQSKVRDQFQSSRNVNETEIIKPTLDNTRKSPSPTNEKIMNKPHLENMNDNETAQLNLTNNPDKNDNANFSLNRNLSKSPRRIKTKAKHAKAKGQHYKLNSLHNKNAFHSESQPQNKNKELPASVRTDQMEQDTELDIIKAQNLQKDLELELEYQNQINQMYNSQEYMELYYQPLQYQPAFHHTYPEPPTHHHHQVFPRHMVQQPPMYYIPMPLPLDRSSPMAMTPDTGSDYSSEDSGSCYELNVSSDYSDDEVFETNVQPEAFTSSYIGASNYTGVKEPEYEVPIEMDEELNMLVLSIIDD